MLRPLCALLLGTASAATASAATLSVVPDKATYSVGEPVVLTVIGDDGNVSPAYSSVFGRLLYSATLINPDTVANATPADPTGGSARQSPVGNGWLVGSQPSSDGQYTAFDQVNTFASNDDFLAPGGSAFATVTVIAEAVGIVNVTWDQSELIFLDIDPASAVGTSFEIVPEPTTAALIGLGLLGLARWRRARLARAARKGSFMRTKRRRTMRDAGRGYAALVLEPVALAADRVGGVGRDDRLDADRQSG